MRLIVARCSVDYTGPLTAHLPEALRLIMLKADGSVLVHADAGGYKPLNWMTPPTAVIENGETIVVRKIKGEDQLEITLHEVISDIDHLMDFDADRLSKDGVEADLQIALAEAPHFCGEGFRLVRREGPADIGPVDLMCRDEADGWIAVEIKRVGTIDSVEQLARYLERIRPDPGKADCRGVLAASVIKPQARVLAEARGIACVEVDLAEPRGARERAATLFASLASARQLGRESSERRVHHAARRDGHVACRDQRHPIASTCRAAICGTAQRHEHAPLLVARRRQDLDIGGRGDPLARTEDECHGDPDRLVRGLRRTRGVRH